jgi:hypothetical protein
MSEKIGRPITKRPPGSHCIRVRVRDGFNLSDATSNIDCVNGFGERRRDDRRLLPAGRPSVLAVAFAALLWALASIMERRMQAN